MKILIIEDNQILSNNISTYLKLKGIESKQLFIWRNVNYELISNDYDLVILDLGLPDIDWIKVSQDIRNSWKNIPILMLTARNTIKDKVSGFNAWADDYLVKPFEYEELLIRIKALVRRDFTIKSTNIVFGKQKNIELDTNSKKILKDWNNIHLSNLELNLLIYLIHNKWKVISKEKLYKKVWWEYDEFKMSRKVDVYVWYIRKKLWKDIIWTVRWEWYIIK